MLPFTLPYLADLKPYITNKAMMILTTHSINLIELCFTCPLWQTNTKKAWELIAYLIHQVLAKPTIQDITTVAHA